ncbi:MAG TPA: SDR family NAD(P)-dependent oxidoreductase [Phycisphaerae bacterium]|nr:SDR family NAD(P)-dependent oxidoreductase [Phycisphaerae bacterium]
MSSVALITGGAVRVGRAIALSLAEAGWDIALHYNSSVEQAEATAGDIRLLSRRCELFPVDLADPQQVSHLVGDVVDAMGSCDLLINNASVFIPAKLTETDEELLDLTMAVNFRAPLLLMRDYAKLAKSGQIINILDSRIATTKTAYFAYSLSKKALAESTKLAAKELAPDIRVNGICPGLVLPADGPGRKGEESITLGSVKDVTDAVLYLLNDKRITGELIFLDGDLNLGITS